MFFATGEETGEAFWQDIIFQVLKKTIGFDSLLTIRNPVTGRTKYYNNFVKKSWQGF